MKLLVQSPTQICESSGQLQVEQPPTVGFSAAVEPLGTLSASASASPACPSQSGHQRLGRQHLRVPHDTGPGLLCVYISKRRPRANHWGGDGPGTGTVVSAPWCVTSGADGGVVVGSNLKLGSGFSQRQRSGGLPAQAGQSLPPGRPAATHGLLVSEPGTRREPA